MSHWAKRVGVAVLSLSASTLWPLKESKIILFFAKTEWIRWCQLNVFAKMVIARRLLQISVLIGDFSHFVSPYNCLLFNRIYQVYLSVVIFCCCLLRVCCQVMTVHCWMSCRWRWGVVGSLLSVVGCWLSVSVVANFSHCRCQAFS
jgi:hypothetical protein